MSCDFIVAALYQFVSLSENDIKKLQSDLLKLCQQQRIRGTLLLAPEGINGTVAGRRSAIDALTDYLAADGRFNNLEYKESIAPEQPFLRLKVRLKQEIVTLGRPDINPAVRTGVYVNPEQWNDLIADPETIVIDVRNDYEVRIGTFEKAINPNTQSFREFPQWVETNLAHAKNTKVALYCTGDIRCEKASAYMLEAGFDQVYHLQGGILRYLEKVPATDSLWQGECFVFDNRVAVTHGLAVGTYDQCYGCRVPLSAVDKQSSLYVEGSTCPYCASTQTDQDRQRYQERHRQVQLAHSRHQTHLGQPFDD